jgi:hypothetical protein
MMGCRRMGVTLLLLGIGANASCAGAAGSDTAGMELLAPPRSGFESVANAMQPSCGTLDCHGQPDRNLRLYGARGLRLDPTENSMEGTTRPPEYEADYWAVVALEPETLASVIRDGVAQPERLILIRKGRGTTRHKGGTLMQPNDDLDRCIVEWLKGNIVQDACDAAAHIGPPTTP